MRYDSEKMATIDPVCKMEIDGNSKFRSKVGGKEFSFCCTQCKSIFEKNPSKYSKI